MHIIWTLFLNIVDGGQKPQRGTVSQETGAWANSSRLLSETRWQHLPKSKDDLLKPQKQVCKYRRSLNFHNSSHFLTQVSDLPTSENFVVVEPPSHVQLYATPWTIAHQPPLPWDFPGKNMEWVVISFSRGSSPPRDQIRVFQPMGYIFLPLLVSLRSRCSGVLGTVPWSPQAALTKHHKLEAWNNRHFFLSSRGCEGQEGGANTFNFQQGPSSWLLDRTIFQCRQATSLCEQKERELWSLFFS